MMVDDILQLAHNQQFLERITTGRQDGGKLEMLKKLPKYDDLIEFEQQLEAQQSLEFHKMFQEPVGNYLIRTYLVTEHSVDKAIFISDVELYKRLNDLSARQRVAQKIFDRFCAAESIDHIDGVSVFSKDDDELPWYAKRKSTIAPHHSESENSNLSLLTEGTNTIGVYGKPITKLKKAIENGDTNHDLFNEVVQEVQDDLRLDVFPRFRKSNYYKMYIRCKAFETRSVAVKDFTQLRPLGRGAFGLVTACEKRDSGKLYAMKQVNKKRVQGTDSVKTIMQERDYLADMESKFVTTLKYALMDSETLYLIIDLMLGGDLKYHLNITEMFDENRARFHSAEILLGLEHIHSKGIVYRDLKLENVLIDEKGHCKISDLGLAVRLEEGGVKGYAGTPGYTAPEVVLGFPYDGIADFYSFGVMVYRCLCGKKPFQRRKDRHKRGDANADQQNKSSQLDRNVIEMEPEFPPQKFSPLSRSLLKGLMTKAPKKRLGANGIEEIKQHPWFDQIDFGQLEAGYLKPLFVPKLDEVHSPLSGTDAPPQDRNFNDLKLTPEFEQSLEKFPFQSFKALQEEMVEVLRRADIEKRANGEDDSNVVDYDHMDSRTDISCLSGCDLM